MSSRFVHGEGRRNHWSLPARAVGLVLAAVLLGSFAVVSAREKRPKPLQIVGLATKVEPTRVSIRGVKGTEVTVAAQEDFSETVAVGSQVTAWYSVKDGVNVLERLEYPLENFFRSANQIGGEVKKVAILSRSSVPDADGVFDAIGQYLESKVGWYVVPRMLVEEIRRRSEKSPSTLEAIDPSTGQIEISRYLQAQRDFIRLLATETRVDAVLEAKMDQVQVPFNLYVAYWDGVQQPIASKFSRTLAVFAPIAADGHVPATTVVLKLRDARGKLLWTNRRGFAVLALRVGAGTKFRDRSLLEVLQDTASVEMWLKMVFGAFLPASGPSTVVAKE